jgi:hypothetical protein
MAIRPHLTLFIECGTKVAIPSGAAQRRILAPAGHFSENPVLQLVM